MIVQNYNQLIVWQLGMDIAVEAYKVTRAFPREEIFGLSSQIRRAAVSIPSNIAEGFNRRQTQDFRRFLQIAYGSCGELETQLLLGQRLNLVISSNVKNMLEKITEEQKMLKSFINKLSRSLRTEN